MPFKYGAVKIASDRLIAQLFLLQLLVNIRDLEKDLKLPMVNHIILKIKVI